MSWQLPVIALLVILSLLLLWRLLTLRRGIRGFTSQLKRGAEAAENTRALGELASALNFRLSDLDRRLTTLHLQHDRLSAILDQLTDGVLIASAEGIVQFANPAAEKLFGAPLTGRSVAETLRHHSLVDAWQRCRDTNQLQTESVEMPATRQFIQLIAIPDRDAPGGSLLLTQDLTRVRKLETVRRDFISNLSHELRTPLASLKALTETLQDGALSDPAAGPRFLGRIQTEVDALTQMAQELLDLSRIESGQVELVLRPVDPGTLLASAADRMRLQAERAGLHLLIEPVSAPRLQADPSRLEQVLVNLIHNSVKFTPPGGSISLSAQLDGDLRHLLRPRHRRRHPVRRPATRLRALLPRRPVALRQRHRAGSLHRPAHRRSPRRADARPKPPGRRQHLLLLHPPPALSAPLHLTKMFAGCKLFLKWFPRF